MRKPLKVLRAARRLLPPTYAKLDRRAQREIRDSGRAVSCQRGCTWCCYQMVTVSLLESFWLADHVIHNMRPAARHKVIERLRETAVEAHTTPEAYFSLTSHCGFLDTSSGDCLAYDRRPAGCRFYFVISPPEDCHPSVVRKTLRLNTYSFDLESLELSELVTGTVFAAPLPNAVLHTIQAINPGIPAAEGVVDPFAWQAAYFESKKAKAPKGHRKPPGAPVGGPASGNGPKQ